ncbi:MULTISPECIES: Crp/Fnr family transcriptional regulator [unclassified Leptolyngbya]|uniref:Crp/Fnr family transcriptional regulator n=1 Tax=unclassified Leptolyngbya TaxID=2650499 RepID=UPI001687C380|nr:MULTISPECIES: Crp/Fnr family transcriptional regulator [unclassified Leptolyngbya]MBD1909160.1 Crp/Fnr family transcriptional regulator [Leptolyngbya sp. FACHB-8]MBD2158460.1 Crp/Fnr family transcriptional regulator [Leptolyngbya sp. FACHB-16]
MAPQNDLLNAFPPNLSEKLRPALKRISLERGERLHNPGDEIENLYFPLDCVLSITITMRDGTTAETGLVGKQEVIGVNAFMGGRETTQTTYIVQIPGSAMKIDAQILREEFDHNKELRAVMLRYTQALLAQISQTTACNSLHKIDQRLARWLLEVHSRVETDELELTQEFMADMLGVRRAGVTQTAQKLQERKLIHYNRGHIHILDQPGLEAFACECFHTVKDEYKRLLGAPDKKVS